MLLLLSMCSLATSVAHAERLLAQDFLELPEAHQKFWIQGTMHAFVAIAAAKSTEQGNCVQSWYFSEQRPERNGLILASMEKYPKAYPTAIMLALAERECGVFRK